LAHWKANGLTCIDGVLYLTVSRHSHDLMPPPYYARFFVQQTWDSSVVKSEDYGQTWSAVPEIDHAMFPGHTFGAPFFVSYGKDGSGTTHDADRYIYAVSSDGVWNNGCSMVMGRVRRDRIGRLNPADWEFIQGFAAGGEPIWRPRHDTAQYIFRQPGR